MSVDGELEVMPLTVKLFQLVSEVIAQTPAVMLSEPSP
jgi:hypothetical protein